MAARTHWATDSPELTERERDTAADKRLYVEIGLVQVHCRTCGVEVGVKKNSRKHTSVQWTAEAMAGCTGYVNLGCPRLKESIDAAVRDGAVLVPDE
jgi:hypothetical protein